MKKKVASRPVAAETHESEYPVSATNFTSLPTDIGPVPVNTISTAVQLTPIVTPMAMVPYTTKNQKLLIGDEAAKEKPASVAAEQPVVENEKKRIRSVPVLLILFSLLILAVYVVGNYVVPEYLALIGDAASGSGMGVIMGLADAIDTEWTALLPVVGIVGTAVAAIVVLLASLIGITRKQATVVAKIALVAALVCALLALVVTIINETIGVGMYIVAALCLVALLLGLFVRSKK